MSGERYWLHTPQGRLPLPGSLKPTGTSPWTITHNLVRARGYREIYDTSDGLPDPVPRVLTGEVEFNTEEEADLFIAQLRRDLRAATAYDRDGRKPIPLQGASVVDAPADDRNSAKRLLTVTLLPTHVPDPNDSYS